MLVKPPQDNRKREFRITSEPTAMDGVITYVQVIFIFLIVRVVMVMTGVTLIPIPVLDPLLRSFLKLMRAWFER